MDFKYSLLPPILYFEVIMDSLQWLTNTYSKEPWYHSAEVDAFGRYVLYSKYLSKEILETIPLTHNEKHILIHFSAYKDLNPTQFTFTASPANLSAVEETEDEDLSEDIHNELWSLKKICGEDNLVEILYEIHEDNASTKGLSDYALGITNVSKEFPEVRKQLEALYNKYGCDILFDEVE